MSSIIRPDHHWSCSKVLGWEEIAWWRLTLKKINFDDDIPSITCVFVIYKHGFCNDWNNIHKHYHEHKEYVEPSPIHTIRRRPLSNTDGFIIQESVHKFFGHYSFLGYRNQSDIGDNKRVCCFSSFFHHLHCWICLLYSHEWFFCFLDWVDLYFVPTSWGKTIYYVPLLVEIEWKTKGQQLVDDINPTTRSWRKWWNKLPTIHWIGWWGWGWGRWRGGLTSRCSKNEPPSDGKQVEEQQGSAWCRGEQNICHMDGHLFHQGGEEGWEVETLLGCPKTEDGLGSRDDELQIAPSKWEDRLVEAWAYFKWEIEKTKNFNQFYLNK